DFSRHGKVWLPARCEITSHAYEMQPLQVTDQPAYKTTLVTTSVSTDSPSDSEFSLFFDVAGVSVDDFTHEKASPGTPYSYFVSTTASEFGNQSFFQRNKGLRFLLAGANIVVILFFAIHFFRKRNVSANA
ncbi:MAG: hypothetical protein AAF989_09895, partial [Planctomycetota bacterium]